MDNWQKYHAGFFDGIADYKSCGCGVYIVIEPSTHYHLCWNGGLGSNNKADTITLWGFFIVLDGSPSTT